MPSHPAIVGSSPALELAWASEADTAAWAARLAALPGLRNALVTMQGELGSGKTTFVRHLLRALGVRGRVRSPTYGLVEPHQAPDGTPIAHCDFYRFADPREWEEAGLRDTFAAPGLKLVEWPERAAPLLPAPDLALHLYAEGGERRRVQVAAPTAHGARLLAELGR